MTLFKEWLKLRCNGQMRICFIILKKYLSFVFSRRFCQQRKENPYYDNHHPKFDVEKF